MAIFIFKTKGQIVMASPAEPVFVEAAGEKLLTEVGLLKWEPISFINPNQLEFGVVYAAEDFR